MELLVALFGLARLLLVLIGMFVGFSVFVLLLLSLVIVIVFILVIFLLLFFFVRVLLLFLVLRCWLGFWFWEYFCAGCEYGDFEGYIAIYWFANFC